MIILIVPLAWVFCNSKLCRNNLNSVNVLLMMLLTDLCPNRYLPRHRAAVSSARYKERAVVKSEMERVVGVRTQSSRSATKCSSVSVTVFHIKETETESEFVSYVEQRRVDVRFLTSVQYS